MLNVTTRPATESDWNFLRLVEESCIREYAERTWGNWIPNPRDSFSPEIHEIVQCDGDEIGCVAVIDEPEALTLEKLYILRGHQGRGIGTLLLERLIGRAHADKKNLSDYAFFASTRLASFMNGTDLLSTAQPKNDISCRMQYPRVRPMSMALLSSGAECPVSSKSNGRNGSKV